MPKKRKDLNDNSFSASSGGNDEIKIRKKRMMIL